MIGELIGEEIEDLLRSQTTGRIGCHADGKTYVVPVTYVYESGSVYGHTARGLKVQMMRRNPEVCFEVDRIEDIGHWRSVIAQGRYEELQGGEALRAMDLLIQRLAPLAPEESSHPSYVLRTAQVEPATADGRGVILFRIRLTEKTGRFERS
jgi:nitroimidazol reductase NimA-like FMN-containing flavoprotein (pyridoxamine 5'-phosphate oxidase superfamily)